MFPSLTMNNLVYGFMANSKAFGYGRLSHAIRVKLANLSYLIFRELGTRRAVPALRGHILHIVQLRANKEMVGVNAGGVVALVKNEHAFWDRTKSHFPRNAMRHFVFALNANLPVAMRIDHARPFPALIMVALVHSFPKAIFEWATTGMSNDVLDRLALYMPMHRVIVGSYLGLLSASAMAVTVGDFLCIHAPILPRLQEAGVCQLSKVEGL